MRIRARVEGTVQGVGFRPYVYRLAGELGCSGHVFNDARGVVVEVEAGATQGERFLAPLPAQAPPPPPPRRVLTPPGPAARAPGVTPLARPPGGGPGAPIF